MTGRIYLDTSVLLAAFIGPKEKNYEVAAAALASAQSGDFEPVLSALVLAEAVGAPNIRAAQGIPRAECRAKQRKVADFVYGLGAVYVEIGERHGRRAVELSLSHDLKGKDALHLALAAESACTDLFTCDSDLLKVGNSLAGLRVRLPETTNLQLPLHEEPTEP